MLPLSEDLKIRGERKPPGGIFCNRQQPPRLRPPPLWLGVSNQQQFACLFNILSSLTTTKISHYWLFGRGIHWTGSSRKGPIMREAFPFVVSSTISHVSQLVACKPMETRVWWRRQYILRTMANHMPIVSVPSLWHGFRLDPTHSYVSQVQVVCSQ